MSKVTLNTSSKHFIIGDVHGCGKTLELLIEKLKSEADLDINKDHIFFLGDYYTTDFTDDHFNVFEYLNLYFLIVVFIKICFLLLIKIGISVLVISWIEIGCIQILKAISTLGQQYVPA